MEQQKLIYQRIANIMKDVKAITKTEKNQQQGFKFRGIDNVMNELHDLFANNEVFTIPTVLEFSTEDRPTRSGGVLTFTRAKIKFMFMTVDGSYIETINVGEASDSGDKGMNKAMSIALKYALLQMFLIPTEEQKDPDSTTPEETDYLSLALQEIRNASTKDELLAIHTNHPTLRQNQRFMDNLSSRKKELGL